MATTFDIPAKYKAAVYDKPGTISTKVTELATPEPAAGEVLIRLTHSGVCHSDQAIMVCSKYHNDVATAIDVLYMGSDRINSAIYGHTSKRQHQAQSAVMRALASCKS